MKIIPSSRKGRVFGGVVSGLVVIGAIGAAAAPPEDDAAVTPVTTTAAVVATTEVATTVTTAVPTTAVPVTQAPTTTATTTTTPTTTEPAVVATTAPAADPVVIPPAVVPATEPPPVAPALTVARVVDGDTVEMSDGTTVRLIGIDTPERGECGFDEATFALASMVLDQPVTLLGGTRDDVDRYGRLLRYVDLVDATDAGETMIAEGFAIARYDSRDGYGRHTREDDYLAADFVSPPAVGCEVPAPASPAPAAAPSPAPAPAAVPAPPPVANASYKNCDAVRAAGAAPIHAGDPGWAPKFDRDGDGVGCE